jgi:hypothetical protein
LLCLTFDTDHLNEARMDEFLERVPLPGAATFFCTQRFTSLEGTPHELCPHPDLGASAAWRSEWRRWRKLFPDARGWRSHSCVFSHRIAEQLAGDGYRYASTHDEFGHPAPRPQPNPWGLYQLPIYYMDTLDLRGARWPEPGEHRFARELIETALRGEGVYVFAFHPIHLLLNSPTTAFYLERRPAFLASGTPIESLAFSGYGVRSFYDDLCQALRRSGQDILRAIDAIACEPSPVEKPQAGRRGSVASARAMRA